VRRLLAADAEAVQSSNELVDISEMQRFREEEEGYGRRREDSYFGRASTAAYQEEEEVEMESVMMGDETMQGDEEEEEFDLFDELNAALAKSDPADPLPPPTPTPAPESSDDEEDDDLFEDAYGATSDAPHANSNRHLDEAEQERAQEAQKIREELADLQASLEEKLREYEGAKNLIIKERLRGHVENYRAEIRMKEQMLRGDQDDDEEETRDV